LLTSSITFFFSSDGGSGTCNAKHLIVMSLKKLATEIQNNNASLNYK
jgi:hypothetical protein